MHINKNNKKKQFMIIAILLSVSFLFGLWGYNYKLKENLTLSNYATLEEVMQQQQYNFYEKFNSELDSLKAYASFFSNAQYPINDISNVLNDFLENTKFELLFISDTDGNAINSNGDTLVLTNNEIFKDALLGNSNISEPVYSEFQNKSVMYLSTPIIKNDKVTGALFASYDSKAPEKVFLPSFKGHGYSYIVTKNGDTVAHSKNKNALATVNNIFDMYEHAQFYGNDDFEQIKSNIEMNKSGSARYDYNSRKCIVQYAPVGINDWYIFSVVSEDFINQSSNQIMLSAILLTVFLAIIFIILFLIMYKGNKHHVNKLSYIAYTDELTGYPNLAQFKLDAQQMVISNANKTYMAIKFDINNFKLINDLHGFEIGDKILKVLANNINRSLDNSSETFARINADEFIILCTFHNNEHADSKHMEFKNQIAQEVSTIFDFKIILTAGKYFLETGETDFDKIFEKVNFAHKLAKRLDCTAVVYNDEIKALAIHEKEITNKMEDALINEEFHVFLQPKYRLKDEKITGCEALVRWYTDNNNIIYPNEFIPIFEQNNFVVKLDMYMFEKSCLILNNWISNDILPIPISVNFSRLHLNHSNFVSDLCAIADKYNIPHNLLEIELTENSIFENIELLKKILTDIHNEGFTLSMDDFGAGYSSLGLLKNLHVDVIKIDKGFFNISEDSKRAKAVIASVVNMAKSLNITTVAEGIETQEIIDMLNELGCDIVQGYYFSKPLPWEELTDILKDI